MSASPDAPETGPGSGGDPAPSAGLRRSAYALTSRIEEIIEAAERAAVEIRRDAEDTAERYLEERRSAADRLLREQVEQLEQRALLLKDHARTVVDLADGILATSREVLEDAGPEDSAAPPTPQEERAQPPPPPPPTYPSEQEAPTARDPGLAAVSDLPGSPPAFPEAALLRVTQMAIAGRDRDEIREVLVREFGITEMRAVDEILGVQ